MRKVRVVLAAAALLAAGGVMGAVFGTAPARAESCPGNPDALGTSRTLVVSPQDYRDLGTMQYKDTLPLNDHEVVITFDDGPLPPWSDKALDILKSQCVKVAYFIIGEMARAYPDVVRREYEAGDTIGTHSMTHPSRFQKLSGDKLAYQIDDGIAAVGAALGDPNELAPFFRIPGLGRSEIVEKALADRSLVVFSADVVADDWFHHIKPAQIVQRAMSRLDKRGRGILLLHDIHPWTVAALPELLKELKDHGYHVVQAVPPAPRGPLIAGGPNAWARAAVMPLPGLIDRGAVSPTWPQANGQPATADDALPAPDAAAFNVARSLRDEAGVDGDGTTKWPQLADVTPPSVETDLAVPGLAELGVSLRGHTLVGTEINMPPRIAVHPRFEHRRFRRVHVRVRTYRPIRRAGRAHRRADAQPRSGIYAALFTPASRRKPASTRTARTAAR
jgi:peptidoglycan/xylan/chitin deacetylase (PgdA/CDA1 family)